MYHRSKKHVHILLHPIEGNSKWDKIINSFIITLIILNVIAVILETEPMIYSRYGHFFRYFDIVSVVIFTIEYVLRVWSATHEKKYHHWLWGRIRYMLTWEALIDLAAILPFYLHVLKAFDLRVLRILRLLRMLRIFRLTGYMKSAKMISNVFRSRIQELLISLLLTIGLIIIASCVMYFAEHAAQPEKFPSIISTLWWSVVTLTTIGYGDIVPVTIIGKILTAIIALAGVALLALPAGIITSGFLEESRKMKKPKIHVCPHCGQPLDTHETIHHEHE
jgi:voltage-gated potassium channel